MEITIYTRGTAPRQANPNTALARLEYRLLVPNNNIVFLQFIPLVSLKNAHLMVAGNPPIIPPNFASAMAALARPQRSLSSINVPTTRPFIQQAHSVHVPAGKAAAKKGTTIPAQNQPVQQVQSQVGPSTVYPDEPVELMSTALIGVIDPFERSLLRIIARNSLLTSLTCEPLTEVKEENVPIVDYEEHIKKCQEEIEHLQRLAYQKNDRLCQFRALQNEYFSKLDGPHQLKIDEALAKLQDLSHFTTVERIRVKEPTVIHREGI